MMSLQHSLLLLAVFLAVPVFAQKVKFKKDLVLIDKQEKFELVRTKKGNLLAGTIAHHDFRSIDGRTLLTISDSTIHYEQLPHERSPREAYVAVVITAPMIGLTALVDRGKSINFARFMVRQLEKTGFYGADALTEAHYAELLDLLDGGRAELRLVEIENLNAQRKSRYAYRAKSVGPIAKREPVGVIVQNLKITEGSRIGTFKLDGKTRNFANFAVLDGAGRVVGHGNIDGRNQKLAVSTPFDGQIKQFYFSEEDWAAADTNDKKLARVAEYLVLYGYL